MVVEIDILCQYNINVTQLLLVGSDLSISSYIDQYIKSHHFLPHEIQSIEGAMGVGEVRLLIKQLSYAVATKKLIILPNTFTISSQNALLKCIEEMRDNVHFILSCDNEQSFLPTIRSRCSVVHLFGDDTVDPVLVGILDGLIDKRQLWKTISEVEAYLSDHDVVMLIRALRHKMLVSESLEAKTRYYHCNKRLLQNVSLYSNNNVNRAVFVERVLSSDFYLS